MIVRTAGGIRVERGISGLVKIAEAISYAVAPRNGRKPASISKKITPSAQMSECNSGSRPRNSSGAI